MGFLVDPSEQHEPPNTVSDEVPEQLLEVDSEGRTPLMAAVQTMQLLRPGPHKTVEVWVLSWYELWDERWDELFHSHAVHCFLYPLETH